MPTSTVSSGQVVSGKHVTGSDFFTVVSGGAVVSSVVEDGFQFVNSGGTARDTQITGGFDVISGGVDSGAVLAAGFIEVASGGTAVDSVLKSGFFAVSSGGRAIGATVSSGASVQVYAGGSFTSAHLLPGADVDFGGIAYGSGGTATLNPATDVLSITQGGVVTALQLSGDYTNVRFVLQSDGAILTFGQGAPGTILNAVSAGSNAGAGVTTITTGGGTTIAIGGGTTIISTGGSDEPSISFIDNVTGASGSKQMVAGGNGGPSYLQHTYIWDQADGVAMRADAANSFIHGGPGQDALQVTSGTNVLDGGTGSNFLTGTVAGAGSDTFFTDARGGSVVWNTVINFHQGDAATLWGFDPAVSTFRWDAAVGGAAGNTGATLRVNIVGGGGRTGDGIDASITFAGMSVGQAKSMVQTVGSAGAGSYLYFYNQGV